MKFIDDEINARLHPSVSDKKKKKYDTEIKKSNSESIPIPSSHNNDSHGTSQSLQSIEMNPTRAPCMKAKLLRKQRKQHKLMIQGKTQEEIETIFKENKQENQAKSIEQLFDEMYKGNNRRLEVGCMLYIYFFKYFTKCCTYMVFTEVGPLFSNLFNI